MTDVAQSFALERSQRRHRRARLLLAASVAFAAVATAPARAEDGGDAEIENASEAIIVTGFKEKQTGSGTKTDTPLMETAQSITVIDSEELIRRNALSINQALGYVAGVSPNQRGGMVTRYDQLILRGFAPGVFLDGMRLIAEVLEGMRKNGDAGDAQVEESVRRRVTELCEAFPVYPGR